MVLKLLLTALVAAASAAATTASTKITYRGRLEFAPAGWAHAGRANASACTDVMLGLAAPAEGAKQLEAALWAISDPTSPRYQQFMTAAQVQAHTAPLAADVATVAAWLDAVLPADAARAAALARGRLRLRCVGVERLEKLFGRELHVFKSENADVLLRTNGEYALPAAVSAALAVVEGVASLPNTRVHAATSGAAAAGSALRMTKRPPCKFSGVRKNTFLNSCTANPCTTTKTLAAAEKLCQADLRCRGITDQHTAGQPEGYSLRVGQTPQPAPPSTPSNSWIVTNARACHGTPPGPPPPPPPPPRPPPIVPQTIASMYNFTATTTVSSKVRQLLGEADAFVPDGGGYFDADFKDFYKELGLPFTPVFNRSGSGNTSRANAEGSLDVDYMSSSGLGAQTFYYTSPGWIYDLTSTIATFGDDTLPHIASFSFGAPEAAQCQQFSKACKALSFTNVQYLKATNVVLMGLGARGTSIFVASGDGGAGESRNTSTLLDPEYPATSPFVTAVGATEFGKVDSVLPAGTPAAKLCLNQSCHPAGGCSKPAGCPASGEEIAVGFSGGGFSQTFDQPKHQKKAVQQFLRTAKDLPPQGCFLPQKRAMPDVAALGVRLLVRIEQRWEGVGGTSASSPIIGGITSRLVEKSIAVSGKPLGLLTPLLYKMHADCADCFTDIVKGTNANPYHTACKGWNAIKGWDPVTGLGTPNVGAMLEYIEQMHSKEM